MIIRHFSLILSCFVMLSVMNDASGASLETLFEQLLEASTAEEHQEISREIERIKYSERMQFCVQNNKSQQRCRGELERFYSVLDERLEYYLATLSVFASEGLDFSHLENQGKRCGELYPDYEKEKRCLSEMNIAFREALDEVSPRTKFYRRDGTILYRSGSE